MFLYLNIKLNHRILQNMTGIMVTFCFYCESNSTLCLFHCVYMCLASRCPQNSGLFSKASVQLIQSDSCDHHGELHGQERSKVTRRVSLYWIIVDKVWTRLWSVTKVTQSPQIRTFKQFDLKTVSNCWQ